MPGTSEEAQVPAVAQGQRPRGSQRNPFGIRCHPPSEGTGPGRPVDQKWQKQDAASILAGSDCRRCSHHESLTAALLRLHRRACVSGWGPPDYRAVGTELIAAGRKRHGHRWLAWAESCLEVEA